jgi:purine-nucleoside phosphorylase
VTPAAATSMDQDWWAVTGLAPGELPEALVVEGSWWRRDRERQRLAELTCVRELAVPDWWWGRWRGHPVAYACVYGAARTVEPVHVLGQLGTPAVVQIGSCGTLAAGMRPGDLVVPSRARIGEGASAHYGGSGHARATPELAARLASLAAAAGHAVHRGTSVSTEVLLRQPAELVASWAGEGLMAVDMETSATFSAAAWCGMRCAALLHAWDDVTAQSSWTAALPAADSARRLAAEGALLGLALRAALDG